MNTVSITAHKREQLGTKSSKELRRQGNVPCVVYGGESPLHFHASVADFRDVIYTPNVYRLEVDIDGNKVPCVIQDIQFHPVTDAVLHIDFIQLVDGVPVTMEIPIRLLGNSRGVRNGGKMKRVLRKLKVKATPENLPDSIDHDITNLRIGQSVRVSDLTTTGFEIVNSPSAVIVSIKTSRVAVDDIDTDEDEGEETAAATEGGEETKSEE
ncbi:MAG: 50S ribosomal protein L25/general stress protein Ctc [Cryomorphaceae bacterium]|nr:50S ribosomal protein L25/general stress protein Ctc [Cryomorphaceae bacterium]